MKDLVRDRKRLTVFLVALGVLLLYFVVLVAPLTSESRKLEHRIAARKQDWKELEGLVREHRSLTSGVTAPKKAYPAGLVEQLVDQAALKPKLSALRPMEGEDSGFDLRLDRATSKEITALLISLNRENIQVDRIQLRGYRNDGTWDVRLYLRR
ncbi:MAG: type II secretion system protein M [Armatimonadetes bacterium]|nr:type II secretion system protein M [Armatimonadota bacterium]